MTAAKPPDTPIERLRNLGPKSARLLKEIGVETESDLRNLGVVPAYRRAKQLEPRTVSLNLLWAMQGGLMDMDWREIPPEIKNQLRNEFEAKLNHHI